MGGYRYLHRYDGISCVIAAQTWVFLVPSSHRSPSPAVQILSAALAFGVIVQLPGQAWQVRHFITPPAAASRAIARSDADIVVVDQRGLFSPEDLVRNDPFLRNRPLTLDLERLGDRELVGLCVAGRRLAVVQSVRPK
jgi:hypothetical protein